MKKNYHTDNKSFMIYKDWEEYIKLLTDEEAGRLFKSLFAFAKRSEEADFDGAMKMIFIFMKNAIDRDGKKWEDVCAYRSERKNKSAKSEKTKDTDTDKDTDKATAADKDKEKEPPKGRRSAYGGKSRSADKTNNESGHSYNLDKLLEYAMSHTPELSAEDDRGSTA